MNAKHPSQLTDSKTIREFVTAGRATLTLKSRRTGKHFTFQVSAARDFQHRVIPGKFWVKVLTDRDKYLLIGKLVEGRFEFISKSYGPAADAPSVAGFKWFWNRLPGVEGQTTEKDEQLLRDQVEVWHEGSCGRCGRQLTHPESIQTGIGPECAQRMAVVGLLDQLLGTTTDTDTEDDFDESAESEI